MKENKNEKNQFRTFEELVKMNKNNELDLFFKATKIAKGQEPYDAIVKTKTSIKYVQLTTMSNLVSGSKQKNQHANYQAQYFKNSFEKSKRDKKIKKLLVKNIERKMIQEDEYAVAYVDRFSTNFKNEANFDSKYGVESGGLINAIFRALSKKANKYDNFKKAHISVLVIIDNSQTFAYLNSNIDYKKIAGWKIIDFFASVFFTALNNVDGLEFFDEIQVYYRITSRKNIEAIEPHYVVNSNMKNLYPIDHIANSSIKILALDNEMAFEILAKELI